MITIYYDSNRVNKQVIRPSEKFFFDKGRLRLMSDLMRDARAMAFDLTSGTFFDVTVELD